MDAGISSQSSTDREDACDPTGFEAVEQEGWGVIKKAAYKVFVVVSLLIALCFTTYVLFVREGPHVHATLYDADGDELRSWSGKLQDYTMGDGRINFKIDGKDYYVSGGTLVIEETVE